MKRSTIVADLQTAEIDFHRGIFHARPVDMDSMLGWFAARINWAVGHGWGKTAAWHHLMNHLNQQFGQRIFDHHGASTDESGQPVYATEPYPPGDMRKLVDAATSIAAVLGLHVQILDPWQSWWLPGWTVRIEFAECLSTPLCGGCKSREQMRDEARARKRQTGKAVCR